MSILTVHLQHEFSEDHSLTKIRLDGLGRYEPSEIFFEVTGPDAPREAPNGNCAIAAVLPIAMARGLSISYQGEIESDFLAAIEEYMAAWRCWRPDLFQPISISADEETPPRLPDVTPAIMAFSGGLDSTFALHAHKSGLLGRRAKDISAALLVQGFDLPLDDGRAYEIARGHCQAILDSYGVRLNTVRTNWKDFFCVKWGMTFILGLSAVLHLFHRSFGSGLFADDSPYHAQWTPWSNNAITNQMLGSTSYPIRNTGASWSRTEKAAALSNSAMILQHLRVCYEHPELGGNCGRCEKCVRTMLNFYACGVSSVPAFGVQLSTQDLEVLRPLDARTARWYIDAISKGTWPPKDRIRVAVQTLVDECRTSERIAPYPFRVRNMSGLRGLRMRLKPARNALMNFLGTRSRS